MTYPWNRIVTVLAILAVAAALFVPSWGAVEADWGTCSGDEECLPALQACEAGCAANAQPGAEFRQCMRACAQAYVQCAIWVCAD